MPFLYSEYAHFKSIVNDKLYISVNFSLDEIKHQLAAQIPWITIIEIIRKYKSHEEML